MWIMSIEMKVRALDYFMLSCKNRIMFCHPTDRETWEKDPRFQEHRDPYRRSVVRDYKLGPYAGGKFFVAPWKDPVHQNRNASKVKDHLTGFGGGSYG